MITFMWKHLADHKLAEKYQKSPLPWPDAVIVAMIPIGTPHAYSIPSETLDLLETLQMYVFSSTYQGKEIFLPPHSMAVLQKGKEILAIYQEEKIDLGRWLQRFGIWDTENRLFIVDLESFPLEFSIPDPQKSAYMLHCKLRIALDPKRIKNALENWLSLERWIHLQDIFSWCQEEFIPSYIRFYPQKETLKSTKSQMKKKVIHKIQLDAQEYGLEIKEIDLEWQLSQGSFKARKTVDTKKIEKAVERLEDQELSRALWEAQHVGRDKSKGIETQVIENKLLLSQENLYPEKLSSESKVLSQKEDKISLTQRDLPLPSPPIMDVSDILPERKSKGKIAKREIDTIAIEKVREHQRKKIALEETDDQ